VDIPDTQNKMIDASAVENKEVQPTTVIAASVLENEYFYPEANGYKAITVRAATREDAQAIYLAKRQPVEENVDETNSNE
jgi:hypothetical protein